MGNHTTIKEGKRVYVRLKNGQHFCDRMVRGCSKYVELAAHGRVERKRIKALSIVKGEDK